MDIDGFTLLLHFKHPNSSYIMPEIVENLCNLRRVFFPRYHVFVESQERDRESLLILWSICLERSLRWHSTQNLYCNFHKKTEDILFLPGIQLCLTIFCLCSMLSSMLLHTWQCNALALSIQLASSYLHRNCNVVTKSSLQFHANTESFGQKQIPDEKGIPVANSAMKAHVSISCRQCHSNGQTSKAGAQRTYVNINNSFGGLALW